MKTKAKKLKLRIPTKWDELSINQLYFVAKLLQRSQKHTVTMLAALKFSGLKVIPTEPNDNGVYLFRKGARKVGIHSDVLLKLQQKMEFLVKESLLSKNPLPKIPFIGQGPADGLANITFDEFEAAELAFGKFVETKNMADLNRLIAILWRPTNPKNKPTNENYTGDARIEFNAHTIQKRTFFTKILSRNTKFVIFLFYSGCRNRLFLTFKEVFHSAESRKLSQEKPDPLRLTNLINSINSDDVTKNEDIRKTNLIEILVFLRAQVLKMEKLKNAQKQHV